MGGATMKWPFVTRRTYDETRAYYKQSADAAWQLHISETARFDALLQKYHALKLQGATIPEPVVPRQQKEIDPLTQAVLDASRGKPSSIRNAMLKQLNEDKKAVELGTMEVADVLRRIEIGFTPDDGIPE